MPRQLSRRSFLANSSAALAGAASGAAALPTHLTPPAKKKILMLGGTSAFLGPTVGTMMLLLLNDVITKFTEYYGLTLGVVILLFALVFRKGVTDFVLEALHRRFGENRA